MRNKLHSNEGVAFRERLKELREKKGLTQQEFAERLIIKGSTVSIDSIRNWEQGFNMPGIDALIAICRFFECDVDYILGNIDCKTHDMEWIKKETGLSEEAVRNIQYIWLKKNVDPLHEDAPTDSLHSLKKYYKKLSGMYYEENIRSIIAEKQSRSKELSALNTMLVSPELSNILRNLDAFLNFKYKLSKNEKEETERVNQEYGTKYKGIIIGENGRVDVEYLNRSFLLSIEANLLDMKNRLLKNKSKS